MSQTTTVKIEEVSLSDLFLAPYVIPVYQRKYSWDKRDWEILLRDINIAGKNEKAHFMSSILIKLNGLNPKRTVVDGQQRITTLALLYKTVIDCYLVHQDEITKIYEDEQESNSSLAEKINIINGKLSKDLLYSPQGLGSTGREPKVILDDVEFETNTLKHILEDGEITKEDEKTLTYKCFVFFKARISEELKKASPLEKVKVFETYSNSLSLLKFISVVIGDDDTPQQIFESINELGKKLVPSEIIKNALLMRISSEPKAKEIYTKYLCDLDSSRVVRDASTKAEATYTLYQWMLGLGRYFEVASPVLKELKLGSPETTSFAFRSYIAQQTGETDLVNSITASKKTEIIETISKYIGLAFRLNNYLVENSHGLTHAKLSDLGDTKTLERITLFYERMILGTKAKQNWALIYRLYHIRRHENLDFNEWSKLLDFIESYAIRSLFIEETGYGGAHVDRIVNLINLSYNMSQANKTSIVKELKKQVKDELAGTYKRWVTNEEIFKRVDDNLPHSLKHAKTIYEKMMLVELHNLEESKNTLQTVKTRLKASDYSHEHWMPQSSNDTWMTVANRDDYCWSVGNHALLPGNFNSKLGNKNLEERLNLVKEELKENPKTGISSFDEIIVPLLKDMKEGKKPVWNEAKIKTRERKILKTVFTEVYKDINSF